MRPASSISLLAVGFDDEVDPIDAALGGALLRGLAGHRDEPAAGRQDFERSHETIPAGGVEDQVDVIDDVLEPRGCVIHDLVGSERAGGFQVRGGDGCGHVSAALARELDGEAADAAGGAVNHDPLAFRQLAVVEEALPGAEPGERDRGALGVAQGGRLGGNEHSRHGRVLGGGTVAIEAAERIDGLPGSDVLNVGSSLGDDARELVGRRRGQTVGGPPSSSRVIPAAWTRISTSCLPGRGVSIRS
jgi:hypothetical protein